jgi:hypothetical protein
MDWRANAYDGYGWTALAKFGQVIPAFIATEISPINSPATGAIIVAPRIFFLPRFEYMTFIKPFVDPSQIALSISSKYKRETPTAFSPNSALADLSEYPIVATSGLVKVAAGTSLPKMPGSVNGRRMFRAATAPW